eukprot:8663775-Ditylum_brightwellii.AAC.1
MKCTVKTVRVLNTQAETLKQIIHDMITKDLNLSLNRCRVKGYDGALNMNGKYTGLAALFWLYTL